MNAMHNYEFFLDPLDQNLVLALVVKFWQFQPSVNFSTYPYGYFHALWGELFARIAVDKHYMQKVCPLQGVHVSYVVLNLQNRRI